MFDWPYSGIRMNGITSSFFSESKFRKLFIQTFVGKWYWRSLLYSDNTKILSGMTFRSKLLYSYSGIRPIECNLSFIWKVNSSLLQEFLLQISVGCENVMVETRLLLAFCLYAQAPHHTHTMFILYYVHKLHHEISPLSACSQGCRK